MKNTITILILFFSSFGSFAQNLSEKETAQITLEIEEKFYYIEFVDNNNTSFSQEVIQQVKEELYNNSYILSNEANDWQGIRKTQPNEIIEFHLVNEFHPSIHRFKDFSTYIASKKNIKNDVEKIVITFQQSVDEKPNFNHISFKKRGQEEWQNYSNAGNFEYPQEKDLSEQEIANWILRIIVALTFK